MADPVGLSRALVEALVDAGVAEVVLAPGSRSAPLALALDAADRAGRLRLHVRVDERGAGFVALGLAKASEQPVAVLTTSGTAVANLHPAVLEAWHSHVPLLVLSADRPAALTWTGSNQTTHQARLFVDHVRGWADIGDQDPDAASWEVARLVAVARGVRSRLPGPVHLNVRLSDPLLAGSGVSTEARAAVRVPPAADLVPYPLARGPRTVVVAGDAPPRTGRVLAGQAAAAGVPLLAEPSSNARSGAAAIGTYRLLLGSELAEQIERVVVVGRPTLSRPVTRLLARQDVEIVVVSELADWTDPGRSAVTVVDAVELPEPGEAERAWLHRWQQADAALRPQVDAMVARPSFTGSALSGPALAQAVLSGLGAEDVLVVGSSNPVRDLDLAAISAASPTVYANRGLAGIDGTVSTAVGVALAVGRPTHALLGDVTLLHDANALVLGPGEPRPDLRLIVANDDGGSIFATLEQGGEDYVDAFERVFATPHGLGLDALARAAGVAYAWAETASQLTEILVRPPVGLELVEVVLDRTRRRDLDAALRRCGQRGARRPEDDPHS